ncbi:hypothetical protein R3P38DRAFT_2795108 [Favolaschia claudopus]|uniref:Uncharacterized protein n=1 Tax=Favolaschia claudopus TaxID=2862362 RepID=A0AAW0A8J9_9AGAR
MPKDTLKIAQQSLHRIGMRGNAAGVKASGGYPAELTHFKCRRRVEFQRRRVFILLTPPVPFPPFSGTDDMDVEALATRLILDCRSFLSFSALSTCFWNAGRKRRSLIPPGTRHRVVKGRAERSGIGHRGLGSFVVL